MAISTEPIRTGRKKKPRSTGSVAPRCPVPKLKAQSFQAHQAR